VNQAQTVKKTAVARHGTVDLAGALQCLDEGRALIVPVPHPLTSLLMTRHPQEARNATGDATVQLSLALGSRSAMDVLAPYVQLSGRAHAIAGRLLSHNGLRVRMPLRPGRVPPRWLQPAVHDGQLVVQGVPWPTMQQLLSADHPVYCADARRRGGTPVSDTASAILLFPLNVSVLGYRSLYGGAATMPQVARRVPTVVELAEDGTLKLYSSGAHDHFTSDKDLYLADLHALCTATL
jgi:hypothetical protein